MTDPTLLIDADILVYVSAVRNQTEIAWGDTGENTYLDEYTAKKELLHQIEEFEDMFQTKKTFLALSGSNNFRKYKVTKSYKKNRKNIAKPKLIPTLRTYLYNRFGAGNILLESILEADDMLGIFQTKWNREGINTILLTIDKDLDQIPGKHYNWKHDEEYEISNEEGIKNIFLQALTGDSTDGYKGCPKIGKVKAAKLLDNVATEDLWDATYNIFKEAGKTEHYFKTQMNLSFILRDHFYENGKRKSLTKRRYLKYLVMNEDDK